MITSQVDSHAIFMVDVDCGEAGEQLDRFAIQFRNMRVCIRTDSKGDDEMTDKHTGNYYPKWFGLAVQALIILAKENIQMCPSIEIANYLQSEATLMRRVLAVLAREGILETREGRDGGYRLKKAPESIALVDLYSAFQVSSRSSTGSRIRRALIRSESR